jgi:hypothetical protein
VATADSLDVDILESLLHERGLAHIHVSRRADRLLAYSGDAGAKVKHARFTALPRQQWALELANHQGRWEPTPFTGSLKELVDLLADQFPWVLSTPE